MSLYLISYDLDQPGQNYDQLIAALKGKGATRVLYSAWALRTGSNAVQIRDWVKQFVDSNDRILVCPLEGWASWNTMVDINKL